MLRTHHFINKLINWTYMQSILCWFKPTIFRATSFSQPPFTYAIDNNTYGGWEYLVGVSIYFYSWYRYFYKVMESIAKYLNYRLDIQPPPNREMWGEYKNGSFFILHSLWWISHRIGCPCWEVTVSRTLLLFGCSASSSLQSGVFVFI